MCHDSEGKAYRLPQQQGTSKGMTNYRNGPQRRQIWAQTGRQELQKRRSELREPQGSQTEATETVMKCKGSGVSCQKLH